MATVGIEQKLAALINEIYEEHPRNKLTQNKNVTRSKESHITQVSVEIEGKQKSCPRKSVGRRVTF